MQYLTILALERVPISIEMDHFHIQKGKKVEGGGGVS